MKLFSEAAEYGMRAVVWLADHPGQLWTVRQIAEGTRSKAGYLIRVIQSLARADIVSSQRGVGGGVALKVPPERLSILDVLNAVDPMARISSCPLGLAQHGTKLCPLHRQMDDAVAQIEARFAGITVADLLAADSSSHPLCETGRPVKLRMAKAK
jgi:Rrf2 family protein